MKKATFYSIAFLVILLSTNVYGQKKSTKEIHTIKRSSQKLVVVTLTNGVNQNPADTQSVSIMEFHLPKNEVDSCTLISHSLVKIPGVTVGQMSLLILSGIIVVKTRQPNTGFMSYIWKTKKVFEYIEYSKKENTYALKEKVLMLKN